MKLYIRNLLSLFGVVAMGVCNVNAALLAPGSSISLTSEAGPVGGSVIGSSVVPFVAPTFSGTLISRVISGDTSNPFGGLTFTYELSNDSISPDPIDRFTLSSYLGFQVDASYPPGALVGSIVPTSVTRNPSGNQISFNYTGAFEGTLIPGSASVLLVLQTDATVFQNSLAAIINSSSVNVPTFAPLTVPEPGTAALMLIGAAALVLRRKK